MGFLIIAAVFVVIGLALIDVTDLLGPMFTFVGGVFVFVLLVFMLNTTITGRTNLELYKQDAIRIELASKPGTTITERTQAINLAMEDNAIIIAHRLWADNFFFWGLYYKPISKLPLFDLSKLDPGSIDVHLTK